MRKLFHLNLFLTFPAIMLNIKQIKKCQLSHNPPPFADVKIKQNPGVYELNAPTNRNKSFTLSL